MLFPNIYTNCIAVVLLVALIIAFPIIGAKAGWKKAAYWGGSNLVFYIIGTLIYRFAGTNIATSLAPKFLEIFTKMGFQGLTVDQILAFTKTLIGPALFLVVFIGGNLILLINYYAWFKKVSGISREGYAKKIVKRAKKNTTVAKIDKNDKKVIKYKVTEADLVKVQSKKYKGLNGVVGCFGLWFAMIPSSIALSQAVIYTTSSQATRKGNDTIFHEIGKYSYRYLNLINTKASWFSFYAGESVGDDYNSLMSLLRVGTRLNPDWYRDDKDPKGYYWKSPQTGEEVMIDQQKMPNSLSVFMNCFGTCVSIISTNVGTINSIPSTESQQIKTAMDAFQTAATKFGLGWSWAYESLEYDIQGLFMSTNTIDMMPSLIKTTPKTIKDSDVEALTKTSLLEDVRKACDNGGQITVQGYTAQMCQISKIILKTEWKEALLKILLGFYDQSQLSTENQANLKEAMSTTLHIFFNFQ